jgi:hypothetical protein
MYVQWEKIAAKENKMFTKRDRKENKIKMNSPVAISEYEESKIFLHDMMNTVQNLA